MRLIPYDERREAKFKDKLKRINYIDSPETFVLMYNQGLLDGRNKQISDLTKELENAYKNVLVAGKKIIIQSEAETSIRTISYLLDECAVVSTLKRMAQCMVEEGYDMAGYIYFRKDKGGNALVKNDKDGYSTHWSCPKKIAKDFDDLAGNIFFKNTLRQFDDKTVGVQVSDLVKFDEGFIKELEKFVIEKARG